MNAYACRGFTLIEVMVALAILAVALTSAIGSVRSAAANAAHLYGVTLSHWAARDAATRIRLTQPDPTVLRAGTVTETVYGRPYQVSTVYIPGVADGVEGSGTFRITVSVPGATTGTTLSEASVRFDVYGR